MKIVGDENVNSKNVVERDERTAFNPSNILEDRGERDRRENCSRILAKIGTKRGEIIEKTFSKVYLFLKDR